MITIEDLKILAMQKIEDGNALFLQDRYDGTIYMAGYSIELALKWKICKMYFFKEGFPENKNEFNDYKIKLSAKINLEDVIKDIRQIKHHDLEKLLFYSALGPTILEKNLEDWEIVVQWNESLRYKYNHGKKRDAAKFLKSTTQLIALIFNLK